ncbi:hypothetical protein HPB47_025809 [Ixodes persulcatus]|uniref:Uncharacterized protein n=1 Tax=Ixodes persulcatus TaxID=34615 RepID=A0AC60Q2C6_IXOPE|nr:hypothetical protein HPB47_025809 [Ixodes persulcatus]
MSDHDDVPGTPDPHAPSSERTGDHVAGGPFFSVFVCFRARSVGRGRLKKPYTCLGLRRECHFRGRGVFPSEFPFATPLSLSTKLRSDDPGKPRLPRVETEEETEDLGAAHHSTPQLLRRKFRRTWMKENYRLELSRAVTQRGRLQRLRRSFDDPRRAFAL